MNLISTIQLSAEDVATALANHIKAAYPQVVPDVQVTQLEGTTDGYGIVATISQAPAAPAKPKGKRGGGRPRKNAPQPVTEVVQEPTALEVLADPESPVESPYVAENIVVEESAPQPDGTLFGDTSPVQFDN